ncbi:hypothetical protein HY439_03580 [Candidatus Microgenomates bacterium]|nr:hypothetical protein [Candidatus Microgenomates bacterium]
MFSLPLVNTVGLFLEESEERDYVGIFSFIALSYLLAPFQGYAAVKGFLEKEEGTWFRTPKTGRITDIFTPGRFSRLLSAIFPGRQPAVAPTHQSLLNILPNLSPYFALATSNSKFNNFNLPRKRMRWISKAALAAILAMTITIYHFTYKIGEVYATNPSGTWSIDSAASANINTSWQLKDNTWSTVNSTTIAKAAKNLGNFQYIPGTTNTSSATPGTPNGNGWIFDTVFTNGSIGSGNWTFTICTTDTDTDNKGGGYLRVVLAKVALTGTPPNQTIASSTVAYDSNTDCSANELWSGSTNANDSCTKNSLGAISFDETQNYLYVEFWNIVTDANDDSTDQSTFHAGNSGCTTDPQVTTTGVIAIPEYVLALIFVVPFIPFMIKAYKRRRHDFNWAIFKKGDT